jgi:predicted RNase H-like nuclease (RuvC/YqgF family)
MPPLLLPPVKPTLALIGCAAAIALPSAAWSQTGVVYRCPGPPVLYTDALTSAQAKEKGCRLIESAPITVIQSSPRRSAPPADSPGTRPAESRVEADAQRSRDLDARRILESELRREEDKLAALQKEYNNGEPERRGDERNYLKYAERTAEIKANLERKQSDVEAIRRELSKLPTP